MTELLIHIGYHKSGTTWLQQEVFCRHDLGFCVPWDRLSHLVIDSFVIMNPFRFSAPETHRQFMPWLRDATEADLVPVITNEDLCGNPMYGRYYCKAVAERLHATFPRARILIGIREQRSSIMSHYRQFVRQGESGTIRQFIGGAAPKPGFAPISRLDHFEHDLLVDHYRRTFGPDKVLVLPLELLRADMRRYIDAIRGFIGVAGDALPCSQPRNVGWGGVALEIVRHMNIYNIGLADWSEPRQSITYRVVNKLCRITDAVVPASLHKKVDPGIRAYIHERSDNYFVDSNRRLGEMIGMDLGKFGYMN